MKAIILAAGYGNRMRPLTDERHKTLLTVAGETIIDRILHGLKENGIADVVVVTGYRADELEAHIALAHKDLRFTFVRNDRFRETNNIFSLALAFDACSFDDGVLLIESDLVYDASVIRRILESPFENDALVDRYRTGMDGTVVTLAGNKVISVIPGHLQDENFSFADKYKTLNIYKFSGEFCATQFRKILTYYAKVIDDNCYYELILGVLIYMQQATIYAEVLAGEKWAEVDDANDLRGAEFVFNDQERLFLLKRSQGGFWSLDVTDFCFIRNMYFPTGPMLSELRANLPKLLHNYGSTQAVLNEKLAYFLLAQPQHTTALNGLSQIYPLLRTRFAGQRALIPLPTFGEYYHICSHITTYADNFGFDLGEFENRLGEADVVVVVNPNNPTGSILEPARIFEYARQNVHKTFLVDESFLDFSDHPSCITLLQQQPLPNIVVLKSLSKALGVPGLRLGFSYSLNPEFNHWLNSQIPIWNLNSVAEHFLEILLKHRRSLAESFAQTCIDREDFRTALAGVPGIQRVSASYGNFILVAMANKESARAVTQSLLQDYQVFVKDCSAKFTDGQGYLRLAVRLGEENSMLVSQLRSVIAR